MRIQHNIMAMNAYRNYNTNTSALSKNLEKLSSGYKINRAGDDAAGLAISEKMRAQSTGLNAAQKNVKDGISLVKTAEGAMQEIQDMLNRMDYLATQSANGTYQDEVDRENLNKEVNALKTEINRIADSANFNGIKLLDGSLDATGTAAAKEPGDYIMLDAGSNKITLTKNTQVAAAAKGTQTLTANGISGDTNGFAKVIAAASKANGFSFDVRYIDEAGAEQTKTITVAANTAKWTATTLNKKINDEIVAAKIGFEAGATQSDAANVFQSSTAGSAGAKLLGVSLKSYGTKEDGSGTVTIDQTTEVAVDDTKTVQGVDKDVSNKISFTDNFKEGDTVTIGGKTYELVDPAAVNNVKDGNIAVAIGLDKTTGTISQKGTMEHLVNALIANGVDARLDGTDNNSKTILVDDLSQISIKRDSIDVKVDSDAITTGNAAATKGTWKLTAGVGTVGKTNMTIKYIDADGKEQSRVLQYTGTASGKTNAAAIVTAINNDEVLNKMFKAEQLKSGVVSASGTDIRLTAINAGADAPAVKSVVSHDPAGTEISGTFTTVSTGKDAAAGFVFTDDVKAGDTISVAGKTFEFVKEGDVGKVANGNYAVVIGNKAKDTAANFNEALKDAGFTTDYLKDTAAVRVVENEFSLGSANKTEGGGLTLQIGDTADKFNQLNVNIGDMHVSAMGTGKTTLDGKTVNVTKTIADIDIGSLEGAQEAIAVVKNAINYVSGVRGDLGAVQNRLEHTQKNLSVMAENIQDAESNIRDTDVAEEMMAYTKNNILVQSAQAMLAQANQVPQGVLQLLG